MIEGAVSKDYDDFQQFAQRELFSPIGTPPGAWTWERDDAGNTQGFFGLRTNALTFARLGHLLLRDGERNGRRLLPRRYVADATTGKATNACYGYLIWTNARGSTKRPCIAATVYARDENTGSQIASAPTDMFSFQGWTSTCSSSQAST